MLKYFVASIQSLFLQTLDIVAENPDKFRVVALAAGSNVTLLADQVSICLLHVSGKEHEMSSLNRIDIQPLSLLCYLYLCIKILRHYMVCCQ